MPEPTLSDYLAMSKLTPTGNLHFQITTAQNNAEYLTAVNRGVRMALAELVAQRRHKIGHSEDALNVEVVSLLRFSGITAHHDIKYGGHTDISVKLGDDFLWIAEAKLWKGCSWAFSGLKQLGRYMSGLPGQDRGAVILYMFKPDAAGLLKSWRTALAKLVSRYVDIEEVEPLRFQSKHVHLAAGSTILVDHIAVPLFWDSASHSV